MRLNNELQRLGIEQSPGIGLFVVDFSAYFPFTNQEILDLDISLSTESMESGIVKNLRNNSVLNHRYPNKGYVTMSQKFGRKRCKAGCIMQCPQEELMAFGYLNLTYGIGKKRPVHMSIPVDITVSDEIPCVAAEIRFILTNPEHPGLSIEVHKRHDIGWTVTRYGTEPLNTPFDYVQLTPANTKDEALESGFVVFNERIELNGETVEDILM